MHLGSQEPGESFSESTSVLNGDGFYLIMSWTKLET